MVFKAVAPTLAREGSNVGFELLGFDFMLDTDLNVSLIEVNENPCLAALSERQGLLMNSLVQDTLALTVDPVFNLGHCSTSRFSDDCTYKTRYTLVHVAVDEK
jgi:Tubulin-tyrosine ligase family